MIPRHFELRVPVLIAFLLCAAVAVSSAGAQTPLKPAPGRSGTLAIHSERAKHAYQRGRKAEKKKDWPGAFAAYTEAVEMDPTNRQYAFRRAMIRSQLVQAAVNRAERSALVGDLPRAREELREALALDPSDGMVRERLAQLAPSSAATLRGLIVEPGGEMHLEPLPGTHNFNYRGDTQSAYEEVARRFGVTASFDTGLRSLPVLLRVKDVDFWTAMRVLGDMTGTFWRPLTAHLFFVAEDTPAKRRQYGLSVVRTVDLPQSATPDQMTEMMRLVRDMAGITRTDLDVQSGTLTLHASPQAISVATELLNQLEQPPGEMVLEMEVLEVDRHAARDLGIMPPTKSSVFTLTPEQLAEVQSGTTGIVAVIEQLLGLPSSFSSLSTSQLATLIGSGQVGLGSLIPPLVALGGGKSTFLATMPGAAAELSDTLNLVRSGQRILLRAQNGKPVTFFVGDRVPITLGIFSSSLNTPVGVSSTPSQVFPESTINTGQDPVAVTVADFNGDGLPDLAVANFKDNTVSIFQGNGDGTFASLGTISTGNGPVALLSADFDGDNIPDLAVLDQTDDTVSIFHGNGDGTFSLLHGYATGHNPVALVEGTFNINTDGYADLAIVNQGDNTVSILLGHGDGTFSQGPVIPTGLIPSAITAGDFNGDGKTDLAVTNQAANTVSVFLGNGDGTFTLGNTYATGNTPVAIASGDFDSNNDSYLDLAVVNQGDDTVSMLMGRGDGTFTPLAAVFSTGQTPVGVTMADFNGDGRPDLAISNQGDNTVTILLGLGDGTFTVPLSLAAGTAPAGLAAGDFAGTGRAGLAIADTTENSLTIILNNASFTPNGVLPFTPYPNSEYEDVGLKIKATPYMHPDGEVTINLHFELRSLSGQSVNGIPILTNQSVEQVVRVKDNQTTMLAGMLQSQDMQAISGTPGLAELGAAGLLASTKNTQQSRKELLILVTPRVVRPQPHPGKPIYAGREPIKGGAGFRPRPLPGPKPGPKPKPRPQHGQHPH